MIEIRSYEYFARCCPILGIEGWKDVFEMKEQLYAQMMGWA